MADDHLLSEPEIQAALKHLPQWELRDGWLRRTYTTPGWSHTMLLVQTIGLLAEAAWHHPDLKVGYAKVTVLLQTHRAAGVTPMDIALARKIEEVVTWLPAEDDVLDGFPKSWIR